MKIKVYNLGSQSIRIKWFDEELNEIDGDEKMTPDIIAHRVVHGGGEFSEPTLLNPGLVERLKKFSELAPLHNPPTIQQIEKSFKKECGIPQWAVFDTAFFHDLGEIAFRYPLPEKYFRQYGIRKFGFHGISHQYVISQISEKKVISLHLGAGCSITAAENGNPIDTTMGFTPLDGLMMLTRSGSIDPGIIEYLYREKKLSLKEIFDDLYFESGLKGVSQISDDLRDILLVAGLKVEDTDYRPSRALGISAENKEKAKLAMEMFVDRIRKFIGSFVAVLNGADALIFTGEIGTGSSLIREMILDKLEIVKKTKVYTIKTREEYQIAKEILAIMAKKDNYATFDWQ